MYPGNVIRYHWAIVFIWLLFQDLLQMKCKFQKNILVIMPFLHSFLFPPAITFLKFQQWSYNFLTRYVPWSKFDKIHTKWIQIYPKLKYVKKKLCFLCLEITQQLFLTIPEAQQTFDLKTMVYWRYKAHPLASSVEKNPTGM